MQFLWVAGLLLFPVMESSGQATQPTNTPVEEYRNIAAGRAERIARQLGLTDENAFQRVRECITCFYVGLNDIHSDRDNRLSQLEERGGQERASGKAGRIRKNADRKAGANHHQLLKCLERDLDSLQIDFVKDGLTYGVLPATYKGYQEMLPGLSESQKARILTWLSEAREKAMDGGTSDEKHALFGKYKGRINNYLSSQGYDLKQAGEAWEKRIRGKNSTVPSAKKPDIVNVPEVKQGRDGALIYSADSAGNRIPDYSWCGYRMSEYAIPLVPVRVVVPGMTGDATDALQGAIDYVSSLPRDSDGFRGAILLEKGVYQLSGRLVIRASGVVLRGSGMDKDGTSLVAAGKDRQTLVRILGKNDRTVSQPVQIVSSYVPVNGTVVQVQKSESFVTGDQVLVRRPSVAGWIAQLGMEGFGGVPGWLGWKPGQRDLVWDRTVTRVEGDRVTLDVPLTTALDSLLGGGTLVEYQWPGRIAGIGIENLSLVSEYDNDNPKDEQHCWSAITIENAEDCWVRQVTYRHFAGSAVAVYETARRITVEDCLSLDPVSELAGARRNTFFTMGQQTLFQRIYAEHGWHDFSTGFCTAGPNAFVQCESRLPLSFSGAADSWASGVLFDIVTVEGQNLSFMNRGQDAQGAGWCAGSSMFWQCSASRIDCYAPPGAYNWAYGAWAQFSGNGAWSDANNHISPRSLFYAQLAERLKKSAEEYGNQVMPVLGTPSTSPTVEQAVELTRLSLNPAPSLKEWIGEAGNRNPIPLNAEGAVRSGFTMNAGKTLLSGGSSLKLSGGWLVFGDEGIAVGMNYTAPYWRGDARPYGVAEARPSLTRFVPGRNGTGYTDYLEEVAAWMNTNGFVAFDFSYGLWYDRRRDDHERIRRADGEVWPPFYELPFARSGRELAWDGLSKYDLTRWNEWYWQRLRLFSHLAVQHKLVLLHQNYLQHNILEAGAHWADFPWRTANNINHTGFPEPPPYAGDKRIFMDGLFYDVSHPVRRALHRTYIRQCLENFRNSGNVIQLTSAEYTGPLHFVRFWLDVIREWESETGRKVLVGLSATKDVQDSILSDPSRSKGVDVIDIRYWGYRKDGSLYAPPGGQHLAPRQHARQSDPGARSFDQVYRAVAEYRMQYPRKAVIYSEYPGMVPWAVFMAGGSLAPVPSVSDPRFLKEAATMKPLSLSGTASGCYVLGNPGKGYIVYLERGSSLPASLMTDAKGMAVYHINPETGETILAGVHAAPGDSFPEPIQAAETTLIWLRSE